MLDSTVQDMLQRIANEHHVEITVTKPGVHPDKWMHTFTPPVPQHQHNDALPVGFAPSSPRTSAD